MVVIVVIVPESHADIIRETLGKAGAGQIGPYSYCSFTSKGVGRFLPLEGADPHLGCIGSLETVEEVKIETVCDRKIVKEVVSAVRSVHPYEMPYIVVYNLENQL